MELINSIQRKGKYKQHVYIPVRNKRYIGLNSIKNVELSYFNYRFNFLKFFPILKILIVYVGFFVTKKKFTSEVIIAHNFWSDGMIAFLNYIFLKTPYVLVVRNTDMNVFIPRLKHYHWLMKIMIKKSKGLIFLNKGYMNLFKDSYPDMYKNAKKTKVLYNGVNDFWLDSKLNSDLNKSIDLIYVGNFNKNKNIVGIINAIKLLHNKKINISLSLVGGGDDELKNLLNIDRIPDFITNYGVINDKDRLLKLYQSSKIFIMPSFFETFGLVYIEALFQGCNIIHSKGQGIEGVFDCEFVQSVNPLDVDDIANKINYLLNLKIDYNDRQVFLNKISNDFRWDNIAEQYLNI